VSEADEAWEAIVEAFGRYGKRVNTRLRGARRKHVERLLADDYEVEDLVAAVHGYVHSHDGLDREMGSEFNPRRWFTPESVFRLEKIELRIELGLEGPWQKPETRQERRDRERQEQYAAARAEVARDRGLRVVGDDEF